MLKVGKKLANGWWIVGNRLAKEISHEKSIDRINPFRIRSDSIARVLIFPPVSNYHRFLIHKVRFSFLFNFISIPLDYFMIWESKVGRYSMRIIDWTQTGCRDWLSAVHDILCRRRNSPQNRGLLSTASCQPHPCSGQVSD